MTSHSPVSPPSPDPEFIHCSGLEHSVIPFPFRIGGLDAVDSPPFFCNFVNQYSFREIRKEKADSLLVVSSPGPPFYCQLDAPCLPFSVLSRHSFYFDLYL